MFHFSYFELFVVIYFYVLSFIVILLLNLLVNIFLHRVV